MTISRTATHADQAPFRTDYGATSPRLLAPGLARRLASRLAINLAAGLAMAAAGCGAPPTPRNLPAIDATPSSRNIPSFDAAPTPEPTRPAPAADLRPATAADPGRLNPTAANQANGPRATLRPIPTGIVPAVHEPPHPPRIMKFAVSSALADPGAHITLTWETSANQAWLALLDAEGRVGPSDPAPPSGTREVAIPAERRDRVSWVLFAKDGDTVTQASVDVRLTCPDAWFFAQNAPKECPAGPPMDTQVAAQPFEHGLMLWVEATQTIHILYGAEAEDRSSGEWAPVPDRWTAASPESDPSLVSPPGRLQPVRGFGEVWRTASGGAVREALGWATAEETQVPDGAWQCDSRPRYAFCYVTGPGGTVLKLQMGVWFRLLP